MNWKDNVYQIFDFLRFPLVLLIVFLHLKGEPTNLHINWQNFGTIDAYNYFRNYVSNVICVVSVPTFFLMSGYLFYNSIERLSFVLYMNKIARRLKTLIVPYVFWITMYLAGNLLFIIRNPESTSVWESVFAYIKGNGFLHIYYDCNLTDISDNNAIGFLQDNSSPLLVPMWFVRDLFVVSVFSPAIWMGIKKIGFVFVLFIGVCYLFSFWPYLHGVSVQSFFYFSIGVLMSEIACKLDAFFHYFGWLFVALFFFLSFFMVYFIDVNILYLPYLGKCFTVLGCLAVLFLAYKSYRCKHARFLNSLAKTSFVVYAAHTVFIVKYVKMFVCYLLGDAGDTCFVLLLKYITVPFLTVAVCVSIYYFVSKFCPKLLILLNGGR